MKQSDLQSDRKNKSDNLDKYFDRLRSENHDGSFYRTEVWLKNLSPKTEERSFTNMKKYFLAHKARLIYCLLALAFSVAACNYPVSQNETMGNMMTWTVEGNNKEAANSISNLAWMDKSGLYTETRVEDGKTYTDYKLFLNPSVTPAQIEDYSKQVGSIAGVTSVKNIPVTENVKRPLYAAALNSLFKIDIDASGMSDKQLEEEVTRQLREGGFKNIHVEFSRDENGRRMFKMKLPEKSEDSNGNLDLKIKDGNNVERIRTMRKDAMDKSINKNMTDAEIREFVKKDFPDLKDNDIQIIRENGDVKVKVDRKDGNKRVEAEMKLK